MGLGQVTIHDIVAGAVAIILAVTLAVLAIKGSAIPDAVTTTLGVALGYLFRGITSTVQAIASSLPKSSQSNGQQGTG